MSASTATPGARISIRHPRLPRFAPLIAGAVAISAALLLGLTAHFNVVGIVILAALFYVIVLPTWSLFVENRRAATDRLVTALIWCALGIALAPLISILVMVITKGASQISWSFLSHDGAQTLQLVNGKYQLVGSNGIKHALIGTLIITVAAAVVAVPIGVLAAIYLVEYGGKSRVASVLRFLVDVMTGIPSIVAGLFAYALFALIFGPTVLMGFGGSIALALLMIPIVVRSSEEMLKLVPEHLREASYALGVPKWRTILKVVLPTASGGIITGITLAIARVIGETAPLLITVGWSEVTNYNLFGATTPTATLPTLIFTKYNDRTGSTSSAVAAHLDQAWGAALVLIVIVLVLNLIARILGRILAPKKGH